MRDLVTILYDEFETLDVCGPVEILGRISEQFTPRFCSLAGGIVTSSQRVPVMTEPLSALDSDRYVLLIPGGTGARDLVNDGAFIAALTSLAKEAEFVLTVCTGSILLSRTGLLNGRQATSNKRVFAWTKTAPDVVWVQSARWVRDGAIYTSSGVSAGMDMALGFISDLLGPSLAHQTSREIEYEWNDDPGRDPFAGPDYLCDVGRDEDDTRLR